MSEEVKQQRRQRRDSQRQVVDADEPMQISFEEFDGRLNPDYLSTRISISSDSAA
jgi:cobalamin biosynthesis Mg chelatase CobN